MKFLITESKYKNTMFKFWDKFGGQVDELFIGAFGLDNPNNDITYDQAYKNLIEWRGEEESKELTKTLLLQNPHHIDNYGSYDFFFEVTNIKNWELDKDEPNVIVDVNINILDGEVTISGETFKLDEALNNEDYGWEVADEVNWGINDYFKENITSKTGVNIIG
jgi:hypothetical protein